MPSNVRRPRLMQITSIVRLLEEQRLVPQTASISFLKKECSTTTYALKMKWLDVPDPSSPFSSLLRSTRFTLRPPDLAAAFSSWSPIRAHIPQSTLDLSSSGPTSVKQSRMGDWNPHAQLQDDQGIFSSPAMPYQHLSSTLLDPMSLHAASPNTASSPGSTSISYLPHLSPLAAATSYRSSTTASTSFPHAEAHADMGHQLGPLLTAGPAGMSAPQTAPKTWGVPPARLSTRRRSSTQGDALGSQLISMLSDLPVAVPTFPAMPASGMLPLGLLLPVPQPVPQTVSFTQRSVSPYPPSPLFLDVCSAGAAVVATQTEGTLPAAAAVSAVTTQTEGSGLIVGATATTQTELGREDAAAVAAAAAATTQTDLEPLPELTAAASQTEGCSAGFGAADRATTECQTEVSAAPVIVAFDAGYDEWKEEMEAMGIGMASPSTLPHVRKAPLGRMFADFDGGRTEGMHSNGGGCGTDGAGQCELMVKNLPYLARKAQVFEHFMQCGEVIEVRCEPCWWRCGDRSSKCRVVRQGLQRSATVTGKRRVTGECWQFGAGHLRHSYRLLLLHGKLYMSECMHGTVPSASCQGLPVLWCRTLHTGSTRYFAGWFPSKSSVIALVIALH